MKRKLTIILIITSTIGVLTTAALMWNLLYGDYVSGIKNRLTLGMNVILSELETVYGNEVSPESIEDVSRTILKSGIRVTYISNDKRVVYDSYGEDISPQAIGESADILRALGGEEPKGLGRVNGDGEGMLYLISPVSPSNDENHDALLLGVTTKDLLSYEREIMMKVAIAIVAGIIVAESLGLFFVNNFLKPFQQFIEVSKRIANGSLNETVDLDRDDEIGVLSKSFNHMTSEMRKLVRDSNIQNYEMRSIISSIVNGVIAVDNKGDILFVNPAAVRAIDVARIWRDEAGMDEFLQSVEGKSLDEFISKTGIPEGLAGIFHKEEQGIYEYELRDSQRIINVYSNPIKGEDETIGRLIVIADITDEKRSETLRREFVANVSHELRTPLTSIKGFVETLRDGAIENPRVRDRFLGIIEVEATRLKSIIEDVLALSEIENNSGVDSVDFDITPIMNELNMMMDEIASVYKVDLRFGIPVDEAGNEIQTDDSKFIISGRPNWFKQMMINLIDNAIKYSSGGERPKVVVSWKEEDGKLVMTVGDNGMGIPQEHMRRLFERFYRLDKARNRDIGGTGLGLAIVKHVVQSFDGEISVDSVVGEGTTFKVVIRLRRTCDAC